MLGFGLPSGELAARLGVPRVTGYVAAGVLLSEGLLGGWLGVDIGAWSEWLTFVALGSIAYLIGGAITVRQLQTLGRPTISIALGESLGAIALVLVAFLLFGSDGAAAGKRELALAFAALAATTDPAASVAVMHQYGARGPLTTSLLGVAALDDALGIMAYAVLIPVATGAALGASLGHAALEIGGGVALGLVAAIGLVRLRHVFDRQALELCLVVAAIVAVYGIAQRLGVAPLLACMALGFGARLRGSEGAKGLFEDVEMLEELILLVFFTLAGAHFDAHVFVAYLPWIALFVVARVAGKLVGARAGATLGRAPTPVRRWVGLGLVPQAGVAIGLALDLSHQPGFREDGHILVNVVLGTSLVFELVGPLCSRHALLRAGEIDHPSESPAA